MIESIHELQRLIRERYPTATFQVQRGADDAESVHLLATVDLEEPDVVMDLVLERMMQLQIDDELSVFVIPLRPIERAQAMLEAAEMTGMVGPEHRMFSRGSLA